MSLDSPGAPGMKVARCQILGKLSTRKRKKGLEWITFDDRMMTVNQSDSVPDRAGEFKHQITLTKLDSRSRKTRYL